MRTFIIMNSAVPGASLATSPVWAHEYKASAIAIEHPWTRPATGTATPAVGYLVLDNQGAQADELISATSPMATLVTLHRTEIQDRIARMVRQMELLSAGRVSRRMADLGC